MNQQYLDKAKSVRSGEELDPNIIDPWLKQHIGGLEGQLSITQYTGGASNWTYCLTYDNCELILRRAPNGTKAKGAHDMGREYRLQQALKPVYPYVPAMLAHCEDETVLGTEFYVMEKLDGIIPRQNLPKGLSVDKLQAQTLCTNVIDCLIELHKVDVDTANLNHIGKGEGYTQRQIEGWRQRYTQAKTWNVPSGQGVMKWLQQHKPEQETICLTHNDFRFDNVVLAPDDISTVNGVLDWELATLGNPLMDLGNTLAYWVEADDDFIAQMTRRQPTHLEGMLTRKQVVEYYCDKMNITIDDFRFYEVFGLFRLAGIVQQIYYRYHHKQTRNPAFKHFWIFSNYLMWRCHRAMKQKA
ncbi:MULTISPECIES: phosphotransferase family protein [Shewanella]|uniref:Phosphotransferase family protein n=1 Tax=Shewanella metallivivens TaxID=2872342 RepID=A0ABT5THH3_9GAMM|nr:phosphotransferase family protein [Shewanella metallivivens]MDD8057994.1 phosphotransferase family protein [Shewanella metallivivens]